MGALDEIIQLIPGYDPVATANGCHFDEAAAQFALDFFPQCLKHVKGQWAGQPFDLAPTQAAITANIFGWKRPDGSRRYREVFVLYPRKMGKTTWAAGTVCYVLFCDGEPGAEIYCLAIDRLQASLAFELVAGMVRQEPELKSRCTVYGGGPGGQAKTIALNDYSGTCKVLSGDANTKDGLNTHLAIIDELHKQPNRKLVDVLLTSTGSRRQPLIIHITTSDYDRPSICNQKRDYAANVRDGVFEDEAFLPVLFEATREDDWTDRDVWRRVNPNLGLTLSEDYLEREFKRAKEEAGYENTFKRLHLNMKTEQAVRWLQMEKWDACDGSVAPEDLLGQECYAGLDLASTIDIAALVLYFPGCDHAVLPFFWAPAEGARERERKDRVPYETWARQGLIKLTEGNVTDYDVIRADINKLGEKYNIREIAIDRWNSTQLQTQLIGDGFEVVPFGQGFQSMTAPTKELEALVIAAKLRHGGHPVLRWMAGNVAVMTDAADNLKPAKDKSSEKIDGIVALIMAIGRAMVRADEPQSVYETRGLLLVET